MKNTRHINHLYWRGGFGLSPKEWAFKKNWTIEKAIKDLFSQVDHIEKMDVENPISQVNPGMMDQASREAFLKKERQKGIHYNAEWLKNMSSSENPLLARMSLFWHGHFACEPKLAYLAVQQLNTIQQNALGNFKDLVLSIAKDPAMIRYLNNQQNRKNAPNENFARELLELFTIGRGNYTEQDIKEAARAFTGWSSNIKGEFVFRRFQHDYGSKTFFGKKGNFDGEDIIDIVLEQPETALFITRKIYKYFVNENIDESRVQNLSRQFYNSNYDIKNLMFVIFSSPWFYDTQNIGSKIKSPVDLIVGFRKHIGLDLANDMDYLKLQRGLGQVLFKPPNVAGWPGGKSWIDNSTLMIRLSLAGIIYGASDLSFQLKAPLEQEDRQKLKALKASTDLQPIMQLVKDSNNSLSFDVLSQMLLQSEARMDKYSINQFTDRTNKSKYIKTLCVRLMTLPEYQMC